MHLGFLGRWEWLIGEGIVLALALYELVAIRRLVRADRAKRTASAAKDAER
jgi:hypothetical protein